MENKFAQQLKKGMLEMLVLQCLARRPSHGYGLIVALREVGGGLFSLREGTLYPILYRLEDDGYIVSAWQSPAKPPAGQLAARQMPKKLYTITAEGRALLAEERELWQAFAACVSGFLAEEAPELDQTGGQNDEA